MNTTTQQDTQAAANKAAEEGGLPFAELSINQKRALSEGLSALEAMADIWAAEIRLSEMAQRIADAPAEQRPCTIAAMIEQAFIEGAYRHFLDHKDAADRASRQVANKASEARKEDIELSWNEWHKKTEWVQEQIRTFPINALGKHRADVMREEIERLRKLVANKAEVDPGKTAIFDTNLLGGPMREYAPGKWESAIWPSATPPTTTGAIPEELATQCLNALAGRDFEAYKALSDFVTNGSVGASTVLTDERIKEEMHTYFSYSGNRDNHFWAHVDDIVLFAQWVAAQAGQVAVPGWREKCEALIDIWDDAQANPPESRCYVESAWPEMIEEVRAALAAPSPAKESK
jgi:hypothetical protein